MSTDVGTEGHPENEPVDHAVDPVVSGSLRQAQRSSLDQGRSDDGQDRQPVEELSGLTPAQLALAQQRWEVLRPHLHEDVSLAASAREASVPLRTAQRWLARYRSGGLAALARPRRCDAGQRRLPPDLVRLIEGLALSSPAPSAATITRRAATAAAERGWPAPTYSTVYAITAALDPQLLTLAHEGPTALRDRYELVHRRQAQRPNQIWQADHTELDLLVLDADGAPARPWLTVIIDDCSRVVAGYTLFLGAPSALNLSLALRQAIWRKADPNWVVHGLPEVLYADHGSDFTSDHLRAVCADLHIRLVHSAVARPQGRGKVERFFGTITTELLPHLPGHLHRGHPVSPPQLTLAQADAAIGGWMSGTYHQRRHIETGQAPQQAWLDGASRPKGADGLLIGLPGTTDAGHAGASATGWLPRLPDSLEQLDLLLVQVAAPRVVHRDGIRFQGLRYCDPTLAAYVGQSITVRYDPRDVAEVRVFHRDRFVCRAISPEHAGQVLTLKDIQAARTAQRRTLRTALDQRRAAVREFLPTHPGPAAAPPRSQASQVPASAPQRPGRSSTRGATRLLTYAEDKASETQPLPGQDPPARTHEEGEAQP